MRTHIQDPLSLLVVIARRESAAQLFHPLLGSCSVLFDAAERLKVAGSVDPVAKLFKNLAFSLSKGVLTKRHSEFKVWAKVDLIRTRNI